MRKNAKQYVEVVCAVTGEKILKDKKEYDRQINKGVTRFFKDVKTAQQALGKERRASAIAKTCPQCQTPFESTTKKRAATYCSRQCAAKASYVELTPEELEHRTKQLSEASKLQWREIRAGKRPCPVTKCSYPTEAELTKQCVMCNNPFLIEFRGQNRKTCSAQCHTELSRKISREHPNVGGECYPRKRQYKDISMDSSWEVAIATWLDECQIEWQRSRKLLLWWTDKEGNKRRYHPDFYLPSLNVYLEPKNKVLMERDAFKLAQVQKENSVIIIVGTVEHIIGEIKKRLSPSSL